MISLDSQSLCSILLVGLVCDAVCCAVSLSITLCYDVVELRITYFLLMI